jgi:hypothetical protein
MLAQIFNVETPTGIDYTITPTEQGWQLTVWEAAATKQNIHPFLWKFRVELATLNEVQSTLQTILGDQKHSCCSNNC